MCCIVTESGVRVALSRVAVIGVGIRATTVVPSSLCGCLHLYKQKNVVCKLHNAKWELVT